MLLPRSIRSWAKRMLAAAVPEPATYALMFAGIGVIAATVRRRKA